MRAWWLRCWRVATRNRWAMSNTAAKVKVMIHAALAKVEGVVQGAVQIIARLTYRQRYKQSTGLDPLICPHCRGEMGV
jgi:hypothetical protein